MSCALPSHTLSKELLLHANDVNTIQQLLLNGAEINYRSPRGWCLLFELISLGRVKEIEKLVHEHAMDIHCKDSKGRNALFWAIFHDNVSIVESLIMLGCKASSYVLPTLPALHYAVYKNNLDIVQTLLDNNVDINSEDIHGIRALNYAYIYNLEEMIRFLKEQGGTCCDIQPLL